MSNMKQDIGSDSSGAQIAHANTVNINGKPSITSGGIPKHLTLLPAKNPNFTGRKTELEQIKNDFSKDCMVYIVNGIGGIGKSELAYKYLLDHEDNYQHIALFEFSDTTDRLEDILINALKLSLYLENDITLEGILYRLQNLPEKCLLVFDNLKNKDDIEKLRPLNNNCDVLITTRLNISTHECLNLDILPLEDARTLFQKHYSTEENIDDILKYIDYHSLFIELIAKTLQEDCLSIKVLRKKFQKGEFATIDRNYEVSFNDFLIKRFQIENDEQLKNLLQLLALLPSIEIRIATLEEIFAEDNRIKLKLNELAKHGWLIKKESSYKLHKIIKEFILANHFIDYKTASPIIENISKHLDPKDAFLNPIELTHYIEIIESIIDIYPIRNNPLITNLLDSQSNLYHALGRYNKASVLQQETLKIREQTLGNKHPDTGSSYNNLGSINKALGKYTKALEFYQKALSIRKIVLGDNHPDTAATYHNLATLYDTQQKYPESLEYYKKALAINEKILDKNHPYLATTYNSLGLVFYSIGKYSKALELYQKALSIREEVLSDKHPDIATSYECLAGLYHQQEKFPLALEFYQRALELKEEVLGDKHPRTATTYNNMGLVYQSMNNYPMALDFYQKALSVFKEVLGDKHHYIANSYYNISYLYLEKKYCHHALAYASKALSISKKLNLNNNITKAQNLLKVIKRNIKKSNKLPPKRKLKICKDNPSKNIK